MLFNSIDFAIFLPIVFSLYWLLKSIKNQNLLILISSYVFYGWWDYRFLALLAISTIIDFSIGKKIGQSTDKKTRKFYLYISIFTNLGILGFFKYCNFFIENFKSAFTFFGSEIDLGYLDIVLPVGISFYTFQTMSYTIDVYRGKLEPSRNLVSFAAFVSFFPQLVAGPIERATNLLPQFSVPRKFNYPDAVNGMRQILWGLFKKMVIADNCAVFVNIIFADPDAYSASTLVLGAVFFAFQIYGDFSGYSDIAIGTARLFGFNLMQNFAFPYFSRDMAEFWRRWHISLSTWFRDYLYIPLGGSRGTQFQAIRNIFIIFLVSGFWHGANWTFIVWGGLNALFFVPLFIFNQNRKNLIPIQTRYLMPSVRDALAICVTFGLTVLAWIFFRSDSVSSAVHYISLIFSKSLLSVPDIANLSGAIIAAGFICILMFVEWTGRTYLYPLEEMRWCKPRWMRWTIYIMLIAAIGLFMQTEETPFIYFQF